jgi:hypothetical protein
LIHRQKRERCSSTLTSSVNTSESPDSDGDLVFVTGDEVLRLGERELGNHHASAATRPPQQTSAPADDPCRVAQGERARDVGRRHLTQAVTDHRFGLDPPRPPQGGLGDLDREDRGLHDADVAEPRIVVLGE